MRRTFPLILGMALLAVCVPAARAQHTSTFEALASPSFDAVGQARFGRLDSLYTHLAEDPPDSATIDLAGYLVRAGVAASDSAATYAVVTRVLLSPGPLTFTPGPDDPDAPSHAAIDGALQAHVDKLVAFRERHPSVALGVHEQLVNNQYTFSRRYKNGMGEEDDVVVVLGAEGKTTVNVGRIFADDAWVRDAYSGKSTIVSYGTVTMKAGASGVLLIEKVE